MADLDNEPQDLGENGLKALRAEREARKAAERERDDLRARVAELETADVRREVAAAKGLTEAQARRLQGSTREELEADAESLLDAFRPAAAGPPTKRPTEALKGGADPEAGHAPSAAQVAAQIWQRR
jgi:hypothetical protein